MHPCEKCPAALGSPHPDRISLFDIMPLLRPGLSMIIEIYEEISLILSIRACFIWVSTLALSLTVLQRLFKLGSACYIDILSGGLWEFCTV